MTIDANKKVNVDLSGKVNVAGSQSKNEQLFSFRQTGGGDLTINAKNARIESFKGKTLAWNQLAREFSSTYWDGLNVTDLSFNDGEMSFIPNSDRLNSHAELKGAYPISNIEGHKYYIAVTAKKDVAGDILVRFCAGYLSAIFNVGSNYARYSTISTSTGSGYDAFNWIVGNNANVKVYVKDFILIDLTLMFGAGNEPSTVAEFEALFPLPYYAYNPGTLISNDAESLETVWFNQWDEEWVNGYWSNNQFHPNAAQVCPKNFISAFPNTQYYIKRSGHPGSVDAYDSNKNLLGEVAPWSSYNASFITPANTSYIMFYYDGGTYNHDICINISDSARNGTYEPYHKFTLPLNLNSFKVKDSQGNISTITGLKSAGNVYDEIVGNKYIKRIGEVDLGTLDWNFNQYGNFSRFGCSFTLGKQGQTLVRAANAITPRYIADKYVTDGNTLASDKTFNLIYNSIFILDNAYSDSASFKTAMSGVTLYYELATPITYDLAEPLRTDYIVDKLGTERVIAESPICSFRADIHYYESSVKDIEIENMPQYLKREELTEELDKLQDIESGAQVNTIEHIKINDTEQTISNKTVNLPAYPTTLPASDVYT